MKIEVVSQPTSDLHAALARLLPQLNPKLTVPDMERLRRLVADPAVTVLVAKEGDAIVG
ncbi:MAG: GNAT family N-acetyltransferase, partial [Chloroflexi bacterium]